MTGEQNQNNNKSPDNKPEPKGWRKFLAGTSLGYPAAYSAITFVKTPALLNAGFKGAIGAAVIGFSTFTSMVVGMVGGGVLGYMAADTICDKLQKNTSKRFSGLFAGILFSGVFGGAYAGYAAVHDPVEDEVLRRLPTPQETPAPETQAPESREKPKGILDLSALSQTANKTFARDQVLMQTPKHAFVLPNYTAKPAI